MLQKKPVNCSYECYWCIYVNTYQVHCSIIKIKDTLIKQCRPDWNIGTYTIGVNETSYEHDICY